MSKMGRFLASRKGKASVKASADTALQQALATEVSADQKMLEVVQAAKVVKVEADEWGAEDSDEEGVSGVPTAGAGVLGGGHFNLISEEDVTKKQAGKVARKWGGPLEEKAAQPPPVPEPVQEPEKKPVVTAATGGRYVPPKKGRPLAPKINIQDSCAFPSLDLGGPEPTPPVSAPETPVSATAVEKKRERKRADRPEEEEPAKPDEKAEEEELPSAPVVMSIEDFLKDVIVPSTPVGFSDEKARQKYVGRRKRPVAPAQEA